MGEGRVIYRVLVRKREGKRPLGKPRLRLTSGSSMGVWTGLIRLWIGTDVWPL
jgi:hypothetical protein